MMRDLSKVESHQEFKELMETLNKQIESRNFQYETTTASTSVMDDDSREEGDQQGSHVTQDILWAFTNVDKMRKDHWKRLESRLLDIYQNHPGIRYLLTSSTGKLEFTCFLSPEELDKQIKEQEQFVQYRRSHSDLSNSRQKTRMEHRVDLKLPPLQLDESVELVLCHTNRELTKDEFTEDEFMSTIKIQMMQESVV